MAKKFIDVFLQGYTPKDPAGQRFVKKHIVAKTKDANGNKDDVFQATNVKVAKYPKSSPDMYEEVGPLDELSKHTLASYIRNAAHSAVVHRADAAGDEAGRDTSATDDDADDYQKSADKHYHKINKRLRGINRASRNLVYKEDVEDLEELSRNTVRNYYNKAGEQGRAARDRILIGGGDWSKDGSDIKTLKKRSRGRNMALKRRYGQMPTSEEVEDLEEKDLTAGDREHMSSKTFGLPKQRKYPMPDANHARLAKAYAARYASPAERAKIDRKADKILGEEDLTELSRDTLMSYSRKAGEDVVDKSYEIGAHAAAHDLKGGRSARKGLRNRVRGMTLASQKLGGNRMVVGPTKEEVEQIDELSRRTLGNYIRRGAEDMSGHVERAASHELGRDIDRPQNSSFNLRPNTPTAKKYHDREADRHARKAVNREMGIKMAASKLTGVRGPWTKKAKVLASEEAEQIDELSKKSLERYANKALNRLRDGGETLAKAKNHDKGIRRAINKLAAEDTDLNELSGITLQNYIATAATDSYVAGMKGDANRAKKRIMGAAKAAKHLRTGNKPEKKQVYLPRYEEAENLDELSNKMLGRYIKSASIDKSSSAENVGFVNGIAATTGTSKHDREMRDAYNKIHARRSLGIQRAVDKLAKEEVEQIDELSKKTLANYITKANADVEKRKKGLGVHNFDGTKKLEKDFYSKQKKMSDRMGHIMRAKNKAGIRDSGPYGEKAKVKGTGNEKFPKERTTYPGAYR